MENDITQSNNKTFSHCEKTHCEKTHCEKTHQNKTIIGRVCDDVLNMPWDKILAGLITGLIIYIGAARLFYLQDKVFETQLELEKLRLSFNNEISLLHNKVDTGIGKISIDLVTLESKLTRLIRIEIKNLEDDLEICIDKNRDSIHDIDKRLSITEVKLIFNIENKPDIGIEYTEDD